MKITLKQKHRHQGETLEAGETIELPADQAYMLIKLGVAESAAASSTKKRNTTDGDDK